MTEANDRQLQELFASARKELDDDAITDRVLALTRRRSLLRYAAALLGALGLTLGAWIYFSMPLLEFAVLVSGALTTTLLDLGEGWLALALMPVNNIASLLILTLKGLHTLRRRLAFHSLGR
jgi:hypothetical protein